mgnify:CR=1 FL=1
MHTLYKKDGTQVQVNDNSLAYALSIGWLKEDPIKKPAPKTKKAK